MQAIAVIPQIDPEGPESLAAVEAMIKFFYTGDLDLPYYGPEYSFLDPGCPAVDVLRGVYRLSIEYELPDLKDLVVQRYSHVFGDLTHSKDNCMVTGMSPKGLAEALAATFAEDMLDPIPLREPTLSAATRCSEALFGTAEARELLVGEALQALATELSKQHHRRESKSFQLESSWAEVEQFIHQPVPMGTDTPNTRYCGDVHMNIPPYTPSLESRHS